MTEVEQHIMEALESVRPYLVLDRGDIEFVSFNPETGVAEVRFKGSCVGCAMLPMTLRAGVERTVRAAVPEVRRVEAVP
ncbi:MAG: hypothetical protein AMXMBFR68_05020 [Ignavibacteria bacterium]